MSYDVTGLYRGNNKNKNKYWSRYFMLRKYFFNNKRETWIIITITIILLSFCSYCKFYY